MGMLDDGSPTIGGSRDHDFAGRQALSEGSAGAESAVLAGVRAGGTEAMALLYQRHRERGLVFARRLTLGSQEAEDVLHEAFVKSIEAIRKGHGPTDVFRPIPEHLDSHRGHDDVEEGRA
ncbi:RNA polymerase sigma factor [Paenarthrobacter histidinolovorans]|uniref:RNA polymerase sigma-70 region 2 domain-containing protein n=1 Tax=Paenarthrobacter histidinolovorans TaxID=43664 RepID=A0ABW8MZK5_9MICC